MPIDRNDIHDLLMLDQMELARIVIMESRAFGEIAADLDGQYGQAWREHDFLCHLNVRSFNKFKKFVSKSLKNKVSQLNNALHRVVCEEFRWCERRNGNFFELVVALAGVLDGLIAGGGAAMAVYLIKNGFFDKICDCQP